MESTGPWPTIRSFSPEKAHAELACSGAAVRPDVPGMGEGAGGLGVPGGPLTSPALAAPALRTTTKAAQTTAATFLRICLLLSPRNNRCRRDRTKRCAVEPQVCLDVAQAVGEDSGVGVAGRTAEAVRR